MIKVSYDNSISVATRTKVENIVAAINNSGKVNKDIYLNFTGNPPEGINPFLQTGHTSKGKNIWVNQDYDFAGNTAVTMDGTILHEIAHTLYPGTAGSGPEYYGLHKPGFYLNELDLAKAAGLKVDRSDIYRFGEGMRKKGLSDAQIGDILKDYGYKVIPHVDEGQPIPAEDEPDVVPPPTEPSDSGSILDRLFKIGYKDGLLTDRMVDYVSELLNDGSILIPDVLLDSIIPIWYQSAVFFHRVLITPLAIDLSGNGPITYDLDTSKVYFDMNGDGRYVRTGWFGNKMGILFADSNGNHIADSINELFGGSNAYDKLSVYDSNGDNIIDKNDAVFGQISVWVDSNIDGKSQSGEIYSLYDVGVYRISLSVNLLGVENQGNMILSYTTVSMVDGSERKLYDIDLAGSLYDIKDSYKGSVDILRGWGLVPDLNLRFTDRSSLKDGIEEFFDFYILSTMDVNDSRIQNILFNWTGASSVDPTSRGSYTDARKLKVVEQFYNEEYSAYDKFGNELGSDLPLSQNAAREVEVMYNSIFEYFKSNLISSLHSMNGLDITSDGQQNIFDIYKGLNYDYKEDSSIIDMEMIYSNLSGVNKISNDILEELYNIALVFYRNSSIIGSEYILEVLGERKSVALENFGHIYKNIIDDKDRGLLSHLHVDGHGVYSSSPSRGEISELNGATPKDSYYYFLGAGKRTIIDGELNNTGSSDDKVVFAGHSSINTKVSFEGNDLIFNFSDLPEDILRVVDQDVQKGIGIERFAFTDADLTYNDLLEKYINDQSSDADDVIVGTKHRDIIIGGKGDDIILGLGGDDLYVYRIGDGNDIIKTSGGFTSSGNSELYLEGIDLENVLFKTNGTEINLEMLSNSELIGSVTVYVNKDNFYEPSIKYIRMKNDILLTFDEAVALARAAQITDGNDEITGTAGSDVMRGGKGDDHLAGGTGVDTYVYARGDGNDIVDDGLVFENNNLVLHGITVSEMKVAFVGYDVVISFVESAAGAGDEGSIRFRADDYWHAHALGTITFDDGTVLNPSQWMGIGYDQANVFHPGDGDRTVRVNFTDGAVHAFLLHGYTPDQVSVTGVDYLGQITLSMVNATAGTPEAIHLVNPPWERGVDQIQFDNSAVWTRDDLRYKAYVDDGTHGSTVTLDTAIYANQSAFVGGTGDTIYIVDAGLQPVSIADHGGTNALTLRGVSQAQVDFSVDAQTDELVMAIHDVPGRNDSVVKFAHGLDTKGVAAVHFDDGSMTAAEIQTWIDTHHLAA